MRRLVNISIACEVEETNENNESVWVIPTFRSRYLVHESKVRWQPGDPRFIKKGEEDERA